MPPATLSATDRRDLAVATGWIAKDSRKAALRLQAGLKAAVIRLGEYPRVGVTRPAWAHEVYRFVVLPGFPYVLV